MPIFLPRRARRNILNNLRALRVLRGKKFPFYYTNRIKIGIEVINDHYLESPQL